MKSALGNEDGPIFDRVDQPMLAIGPSRPEAGPVAAQRLGFADAPERIALDGAKQFIDS